MGHGLLAGFRCPDLGTEEPQGVALRVLAMLNRYPNAVARRRTAAALHRLWLIGHSGPVHLARCSGFPRLKHDVVVDTIEYADVELCEVLGVRATTLVRTAAELIHCSSPGEALAVADSAMRAGCSLAELTAAAEAVERPAPLTSRVLALADPRSDSALESMSRWLFHISRIPMPEPQVLIGDDSGPFALVDFLWREVGVVGEADGALKYDLDGDARRAEALRQERLERMGFVVVRWTFDDVIDRPAATVARVREALATGAARRGTGV
jgi:hypothetical protein